MCRAISCSTELSGAAAVSAGALPTGVMVMEPIRVGFSSGAAEAASSADVRSITSMSGELGTDGARVGAESGRGVIVIEGRVSARAESMAAPSALVAGSRAAAAAAAAFAAAGPMYCLGGRPTPRPTLALGVAGSRGSGRPRSYCSNGSSHLVVRRGNRSALLDTGG